MLTPVKFTQSTIVEARGYNAGEVAGFEPGIARSLIESGRAVRMPRSAGPLIDAVRSLRDPRITRLADAFAAFAPRIAALEELAASVRAYIADEEKREAHALALEEVFDAEPLRDAAAKLRDLERQIRLLDTQEEPLLTDLLAAVAAHVERTYTEILTSKVAPVLRSIAGQVQKARAMFDGLRSARQACEDLRAVAQVAGIETAALNDAETAVLAEVAGSHAASTATGHTRLPETLDVLLKAIAVYQEAMLRTERRSTS